MAKPHLPVEVIQKTKTPEAFIAIAFIAPRSQQWEYVRGLLNSADELFTHGNVTCGLFAQNPSSVELAHRILEVALDWKTCHLFINGVPVVSIKQIRWLPCFISSLKVKDLKAHCIRSRVIGKYIENRYIQYTIFEPCRFMPNHEWFHEDHPSSFEDQFQATAVRQGVDQCPHSGKFLTERPKKLASGLDFMKKAGFYY